jgi:anti-anti-sigma regulatory factor
MHRLLVPASLSADRSAVATWIAEAVDRRFKVVYKHAPTEDAGASLARCLPAAHVDLSVLTTGQVQPVDTTQLRVETGGRHEALYALHLQQLRQASRQGFAGLALTGDSAAMRTITRDDVELAGYERDLERLATEAGVRSLCRYPVGAGPALLDDMLAVHFRDVVDEAWSVEVIDRRLRVSGELDYSNVDRFASVLRAALRTEVRTLDASALAFCDVAGIRALVSAVDVHPEALPLTVTGVNGVLASVLAVTGAMEGPALRVGEREAGA